MSDPKSNPANQALSQRQRWVTYGLNVAVLIIAVLAIVIFINWISYRHYRRFDFTATRKYSLSDQTRQLLDQVDQPVRAVALFVDAPELGATVSQQQEQVLDLLQEYARRGGGNVDVQHIDPVYQAGQFEQFAQQIRQRYAESISRYEQTLDEALATLERSESFAQQQAQQFALNLPRFTEIDPQTRQLLTQVANLLSNLSTVLNLDQVREQVSRTRHAALPDYAAVTSLLTVPMQNLQEGLLAPAISQFRQIANQSGTPDALKDFLLAQVEAMQPLQEQLAKTLDALQPPADSEYDETRRNLLEDNSIVLMTDKRLTVIRLSQVFTDAPPAAPGEVQPERRFRGEEAITGALVGLTRDQMPRIVFVNLSPQPAISANGEFSYVAELLRNMNFDVVEWSPTGRRTQFGAMPPEPMPTAEPGQKLVMVVLPPPPPNPQMPYNMGEQAAAEALREHLASGQPALVIASPSQMAAFGGKQALMEPLANFGIHAQTDTLLFTSQRAGEQSQPTTVMQLDRWPDESAISRALGGLVGLAVQAVPLELTDEATAATDPSADDEADQASEEDNTAPTEQPVRTWPLAVTPPESWAETNWTTSTTPKQNPGEATGPFVIAAAAEKADTRLIVIADAIMATDRITRSGPRIVGNTLMYMYFPANAELFVNSVYWLSGLDQLIATSARTQDVRRYEEITPIAMTTVWWIVLAGLPLASLTAGGVVWMVRRK